MPKLHYQYLIALGTNLGDLGANLDCAEAAIAARLGNIAALAKRYRTDPIGAADQTFLNSALVVLSDLDPESALREMLAIEEGMGRVRSVRWGNRIIDLDLLMARSVEDGFIRSSIEHDSPQLTLPHPEMLKRDFVLLPACDIAADWTHPRTGKTLQQALANLQA